MEYKIYKMSFQTAVHFGNGSLEDGEYTFYADTLFSSLCQEAIKLGKEIFEEFYQCVKCGNIIFSDAFPYIADTYYLPKPMKKIAKEFDTGNSVLKKAYKKLKYIPTECFQEYLHGDFDVLHRNSLEDLGYYEMKTSVSIRGEEEPKPYRVGQFFFSENSGLYFIVGYETKKSSLLMEELLEKLTYSGIGGERSSGYGRFVLFPGKMNADILKRLKTNAKQYMSLSISLPNNEELKEVIKDAEYVLVKRSGFVSSETYAQEQQRKKDLYVLKSGACFKQKFEGDIYDVSHKFGNHAVYRYAKPMLMGVDV